MNIYITLDYELFFGNNSGSVDRCIIIPTEKLLKIVDPYGIKFVCFVDAGYLIQMEKQMNHYPQLKSDYNKVCSQLRFLSDNGHGIELHVHPHWEDSFFDGEKWVFDTSRYKLANYSETEIFDIVTRYTNVLKSITGKAPVAYRAGGWSAQPFLPIQKALVGNGIFIDSTVFPKGFYTSNNQVFDFRNVPQYHTKYRFSDDLTTENVNGNFTEFPISSYRVIPIFFWQFALRKIFKTKKHLPYGNGCAVSMPRKEKLRLMSKYSQSVVSIDGYKASLIEKAFKKYKKHTNNQGHFVLIGHPKAFTPYSLKKLERFIYNTYKKHDFTIFK